MALEKDARLSESIDMCKALRCHFNTPFDSSRLR